MVSLMTPVGVGLHGVEGLDNIPIHAFIRPFVRIYALIDKHLSAGLALWGGVVVRYYSSIASMKVSPSAVRSIVNWLMFATVKLPIFWPG